MSHLFEPSKNQYDAFGRLEVSNPLTLFDSSHRYKDNGLWATQIVGSGSTFSFNANQGLIDLTVGVGSTCKVIRETLKVFSYQPGKGLNIKNTGVMNAPKPNLVQRIGYFGDSNGLYFEQEGSNVYAVLRSSVTGIISNTRVPQSEWNLDTLTGVGVSNPSGIKLDLSKVQIFYTDIEWLGAGDPRVGFVIGGKRILAHQFKHSNFIDSTYMTTGSLPLRYEIFNTGVTTTMSTFKQICSTVISEGGYELRGAQQAVGTAITSPIALTTAGTFYNIISLRLKSNPDRLDAIAIITALSLLGGTNNANYSWQLRASATTTGGSWTSAGPDSSIEYKIDAATVSGGRILAAGYFNASQQGSTPIDILREALFKFQLERDGLSKTPYEITLTCAGDTNGATVFGSMDWEEISR